MVLASEKILILGMGREGMDTFRFLRRLFPQKVLGIADILPPQKLPKDVKQIIQRDKHLKTHLGRGYLSSLKHYDIVVVAPGIPPRKLKKGLSKLSSDRPKITSQTKIFFDSCPGKIIGVTGTKGKSTTSSLIYAILKGAKVPVYLIGNIGKPALASLQRCTSETIFIYELSSFQLQNLKKSPHIAVLLNIYQEHLDYHGSFAAYVNAKTRITKYQTKKDYLIFNTQNKIVKKIALQSRAKKIPFRGTFSEQNIAAAKQVAKILRIPVKTVKRALKKFRPLPHRLEHVGTFHGISFYNDSLATIPEATIGAMGALGKNVKTMILGGFDRRYDFTNLAKEIVRRNIETLILFPPTGKRIWKAVSKVMKKVGRKVPKKFYVDNMQNAVKLCYMYTPKKTICLLSPASPSFGIFKDYRERGDLFKRYTRQLKK